MNELNGDDLYDELIKQCADELQSDAYILRSVMEQCAAALQIDVYQALNVRALDDWKEKKQVCVNNLNKVTNFIISHILDPLISTVQCKQRIDQLIKLMGDYLRQDDHLMAGAINTALNKTEVYRLYEGTKAIHSLPQNLNEIIQKFKSLKTVYPKDYIGNCLKKGPKSYCFPALRGYVEIEIACAKLNENNKEEQNEVLKNT